jgi:glycosyltransferase involved in cell wall biosynthesis
MPRSICFVGHDNYPVLNPAYGHEYFGGESVQQTLLAKAFATMGYEVSMVVKDHGQPDGETFDGIVVWKTFADAEGIPVIRFLHPRATSVLRALKRADADVYYQSCAGVATGLVAWHCRRRQRRFVFRLAHDTDCVPGQQIIRFWRDRKIYEYGLRRADFIAAQSVQQADLLRRHYGLASTVINMAVELPSARNSDRDIDVLWVNNIRGFKRPALLIELATRLPTRRFVMIGGVVPGNEALYAEIESRAGHCPNLEFLGAVPYSRVNSYFDRAKVFVNTSEHEGFPNSFLQAWVRAVPVVSFFDPDGLIRRLGLGDAPQDLESMAAAIEGLLSDEGRRIVTADRCRTYALENYSPEAVARRYVALGALGGGDRT